MTSIVATVARVNIDKQNAVTTNDVVIHTTSACT